MKFDPHAIVSQIVPKFPSGNDVNRPCPYCQAGHRRHTSHAKGHWHTIVVRCWDQDKKEATPDE